MKKIRSKYREGQNGNLKKIRFYLFLLPSLSSFLSPLSLSPLPSRASRAPSSLPAPPVATTGHADLRCWYHQLRLVATVMPRPVAAPAPAGARRKLDENRRFSPELHLLRSPSFLNQIVRVSFINLIFMGNKAPEDRQNHKRDLQRVQLARTSSCRSAQASTTGPLLASAPPRNVGFYCKSS
ncbi:uncharacterized protein LOC109949551 isoform X1 [Prunus persica]|uniref:uncharacterized protein LOC109949551 isoform X1 n=1 Tax=Prunus persica TaxID=3760 RepID=UPI0009ABA9BF|nr:uncharacterized protein LOC109949551 isoform X1 [Prunus persica]